MTTPSDDTLALRALRAVVREAAIKIKRGEPSEAYALLCKAMGGSPVADDVTKRMRQR